MGHNDERLPPDLHDIAQRLTEARATFSPLELDDLRGRLRRRVERGRGAPGPRRFASRLRMGSVAGLLAAGLMLTSGVAVVIAGTSIGNNNNGNNGNNNGGGGLGQSFDNTFHDTNVNDPPSASYCQYHGPGEHSYRFRSRHGWVDIDITWDCRHIHFHFDFDPDRGYRLTGFDYRYGQGSTNRCQGSSYDADAPAGTTEISVDVDGSSYNLPVS